MILSHTHAHDLFIYPYTHTHINRTLNDEERLGGSGYGSAYQPAHLAKFIGRPASPMLTSRLIRPGIYVIWPEHGKAVGGRSLNDRLPWANLSGDVKIARYRERATRP